MAHRENNTAPRPPSDEALRAANEIVRMWVGVDHVGRYVYPVALRIQKAIDQARMARLDEAKSPRDVDGQPDYDTAAGWAVRAVALGAETPGETVARLKGDGHLGRWLLNMPPNTEVIPNDYANFDGTPPRRKWYVKSWQSTRLGSGSTLEEALRTAGIPEPTDAD